MKVLVACEESQAVTTELRRLGHEAYSCDIIECSGGHPEWHIRWDALALINGNCSFMTADHEMHHIDGKWDMLIAFPPCTYLTAASACRMYPTKGNIDQERYAKAKEAKQFFLAFYNADCDRIAVENPRPLNVVELPAESQRVQPWEYAITEDEYFTKMTYLWLKGLPNLVPVRVDKPEKTRPFVNAGSKRANGEPRNQVGCRYTALERSKTFHGIAKAMAEQWGGVAE